jgi:hypothetical protein
MKKFLFNYLCYSLILIGCSESTNQKEEFKEVKPVLNYANDRDFLNKYDSVIELHNGESKLLIVPKYQGRVMTSTCKGDSGYSFGWINYNLIQSKKIVEHINPFGGEERLWLAPEGGQFSFFFTKSVPYDFEHWFTPKEFDTEPFQTSKTSDTSALFTKDMVLSNRSGNIFNIHIDRKISLLDRKKIEENLGINLGKDVQAIGYESSNTIINSGKNSWTRETGAPAIWLLGMLKPSPQTTIVLPIEKSISDTTILFHDKYFGAIPADRWKVEGDHGFLKADGKFRGKVGIPPQHVTNFIGSYDAGANLLTLLESTIPKSNDEFVNSLWEEQKEPFSGDAFNAYNDGPLKDGSQLGPFYELESLSPAAFLAPGKSLRHTQITYHFQGDVTKLNKMVEIVLGVVLQNIQNAFK